MARGRRSDRTQEAIDRAERGADPAWKRECWARFMRYLINNEYYFCDWFWETTGMDKGREPRAFGGLVGYAVNRGYIKGTGEFKNSRQNNDCPKEIYKSMIFQNPPRKLVRVGRGSPKPPTRQLARVGGSNGDQERAVRR